MWHEQQGYKYPTPGLSDAWFSLVEGQIDRAIEAATRSQMMIDAMEAPLPTRFPELHTQTSSNDPWQLYDRAIPFGHTQGATAWPTAIYDPTMPQVPYSSAHPLTAATYSPVIITPSLAPTNYSPATATYSPTTTSTAYSPNATHGALFPLDNRQRGGHNLLHEDHHQSVPTLGLASSVTDEPARVIAGTSRMRALGGAGSAPRAQTNRNASSPAPAVSTPPPPSAIDALVNKFPPFEAATIGRAATSTAGYPDADTQHRGVFVVDVPKLRKDWENVQVTKTRSATHIVECAICRQAGMPRWFKDEAAMRRHRDLHYRAACIFCGRVAAARTDIFTSHCREGRCSVHRELSAVKGAVAAWLKRHGLAHHWQLGLGGQ